MTLWTHALAALLFATLALAEARRPAGDGGGAVRKTFVMALAATALWALAVAGIDARDVATRVMESVRNLAWLGFMFALARRDRRDVARWIASIYGAVALVVTGCAVLAVAGALAETRAQVVAISDARLVLRMLSAIGALILVHRLLTGTATRRGGIRLTALALALIWSIDLAVYATAWTARAWPTGLVDARGALLVVLAPLFGIAAQRGGDGRIQLSRAIAFQSLAIVLIGLYVLVTGIATGWLAHLGGTHVRLVQTAFVFGTAAALLTMLSTPWIRAWTKVIVAKHLFSHRYDYRAEWLRFTETLGAPAGAPDATAAPLAERVVKAVADLTDSPGGLLLLPDGEGLAAGARWNWPEAPVPPAPDAALASHLAATGRIVALDAVRVGADVGDASAVGGWLSERRDAWAVVPLVHFDRLAGAIVLARPPVDRALDWEDFDLLGVAGRQAASYLAEDRAHDALADAQRFDEFNRRFAFIMHDLKNLVSQLTLVARNAERHADNPAFRADMVATLQDSSARMNNLLARLSQHHAARGEPPRAVPLLALAGRIAAARRAQHPVTATGDATALALADPAALETILGHLVQNAIEASTPGAPVTLTVARDGAGVAIDVADEGCGMSAAFLRDQLFRPFASSKNGGFGLGAFEARQLAEAMGGGVTVTSREGAGTRFRVTLPAAMATNGMGLAA